MEQLLSIPDDLEDQNSLIFEVNERLKIIQRFNETIIKAVYDEIENRTPYVKGTWTPTLTGGADLSGYNEAKYTKIGRLVFFRFAAINKNVTTGGSINVSLPFTSVNNNDIPVSYNLFFGTWTLAMARIQANTDYMQINKDLERAAWIGTENNVQIYIRGFYEVS